MMRARVLLALAICSVGCTADPRSQTEVADVGKPKVAPVKPQSTQDAKPSFDPKDVQKTFAWFLDARRRLGEEYEVARVATVNPLVEEPMARFADSLKRYRQSITSLVGRRVSWMATVDQISKQGVKIRFYEFGKIDPNATSTRAATYGLHVYVNAEEDHFGKYGHSTHGKEETLVLDQQIPLAFARTLRYGDKLMISGTVARVITRAFAENEDDRPPDVVEIFLANAVASPI